MACYPAPQWKSLVTVVPRFICATQPKSRLLCYYLLLYLCIYITHREVAKRKLFAIKGPFRTSALFPPVRQYERLINRSARSINERGIMIQAPQWAQINQSGNIEVSGIAKLVYVQYASPKPTFIIHASLSTSRCSYSHLSPFWCPHVHLIT